MASFAEILEIFSYPTKSMMDELKVSKYLRGLRNFGLYPTLTLLEEYEIAENYEECHNILIAVRQQIANLKKANITIADDLDFPTHIRQFREEKYREMFDSFGLTADAAIANNKYYVDTIKRMK